MKKKVKRFLPKNFKPVEVKQMDFTSAKLRKTPTRILQIPD